MPARLPTPAPAPAQLRPSPALTPLPPPLLDAPPAAPGTPYDKLHFCFRVYDSDGSNSIERFELQEMFTAMLLRNTGAVASADDDISPDMQELIDDFVNGIYDAFDTDRSESLEFSEVLSVVQRQRIKDVWEVFGRTLISSV